MRRRHELFWKVFPISMIVTLVCLLAVTLHMSASFRRFYIQRMGDDLEARSLFAIMMIQDRLHDLSNEELDVICRDMADISGMRITVVAVDGSVMGDSHERSVEMEDHSEREEFKGALAGKATRATRPSSTTGSEMMYIAVPVMDGGEVVSVVRTSMATSAIDAVLRRAYYQMVIGGIAASLIAIATSFALVRRVTAPLEEMRREFVANVSHELRTPITSVKGFAETLLDGGASNPEETRRFLEIIARQSDRLEAIIEDLLTLSRLDKDSDASGIPLEQAPLRAVISNAADVCRHRAVAKHVRIDLHCGEHLMGRINPPLLEQAVVNLVDNAIKFSPEGGVVSIEGRQEKRSTVIHVRDNGIGIDKAHLSRLFERFYRVDKARSREMGGTGLGLSIVKHIAILHRGRVFVDSTPGQGSVFSIYLPSS